MTKSKPMRPSQNCVAQPSPFLASPTADLQSFPLPEQGHQTRPISALTHNAVFSKYVLFNFISESPDSFQMHDSFNSTYLVAIQAIFRYNIDS
jgi:hypothetical protein